MMNLSQKLGSKGYQWSLVDLIFLSVCLSVWSSEPVFGNNARGL